MAVITVCDEMGASDLLYHRNESSRRYESDFNELGLASKYSERLLTGARNIYNRAKDHQIYRKTIGSFRRARNRNKPDAIEQLTDIGSFQHAKAKMRKMIMANPAFKNRARANRLDGYREVLDDDHKWLAPEHDRHFQIITDGCFTVKDKAFHNYMLGELKEYEYIGNEDRGDIMLTWFKGEALLDENGDDPSSQSNASL